MKTHPFITTLTALLAAALVSATAGDDVAELSQQGWQLLQSGKQVEATAKFQEAVKLAPKDANAWNGLGWASFNSGHAADAEKAFETVIAIAPEHPAALNGLGQISLSRREYAKAEPVLLKAAAQMASAAWYGLARLYLLEGRFAEAEKWAQILDDSGQGDAVAKKMLDAAKEKKLSDGLRMTIEPPAPAGR
ncbi:MAG: tetratricopeptide repeat protein [Chthoniobacteraceae bacterium]